MTRTTHTVVSLPISISLIYFNIYFYLFLSTHRQERCGIFFIFFFLFSPSLELRNANVTCRDSPCQSMLAGSMANTKIRKKATSAPLRAKAKLAGRGRPLDARHDHKLGLDMVLLARVTVGIKPVLSVKSSPVEF